MKQTILIFIFCLVVSLTVLGCVKNQPAAQTGPNQDTTQTLPAQDGPATLLANLKTLTKINFSEVKDQDFDWLIKEADETRKVVVRGRGFSAARVSSQQQSLLIPFFALAGFEMDAANLTAGAVSGLTGYKKDNLICLVQGRAELDEQGSPLANKAVSMIVSCGELNQPLNKILEVSAEEIIKKLLADKYNRPVSGLTLTIQKETSGHVRGLVRYADEQAPGNSGMFLAAKIDGEWQLLFDGNGAFACLDMQPYGFPQEMLEGCF